MVEGEALMISVLQNCLNPTSREKLPQYISLTTDMMNLPFCIRQENKDWPQHLHIPCKIPLDIIPTPTLSHLGWWAVREGWCHLVCVMDRKDRLGWTILRKCPPQLNPTPKSGTRCNE